VTVLIGGHVVVAKWAPNPVIKLVPYPTKTKVATNQTESADADSVDAITPLRITGIHLPACVAWQACVVCCWLSFSV